MTHEWIEVQFIYGTWIECTCGFKPTSQEDMDNHGKDQPTMNIHINEDLILTLDTTEGRMRIYPSNGRWTIEAIDTDVTGQPPVVVTDIEHFTDALQMVLGKLYNAVAILDSEQTLKAMVVGGLAGPMMEEYREKANRAVEQTLAPLKGI